jgi:ribosomal protein L11 methyltransferase
MNSDAVAIHLVVHECRGNRLPAEKAPHGVMGVWPEPPYYYVFCDRETIPALTSWLQGGGLEWRRTYRLDYDQWQQVLREECRVGPFRIVSGGFDLLGKMLPQNIKHLESERLQGFSETPPNPVTIHLDPGLVFGSGLHPTTRGCLLAIAQIFRQESIETVVDVGTGTGILAIACALAGARRVIAFDKNPMAVEVARRNVLANGVADRVHVLAADRLEVLKEPSDLLIMNLEWSILEGFWVGRELQNYRWVVLSGLTQGQWEVLRGSMISDLSTSFQIRIQDWESVGFSKRCST